MEVDIEEENKEVSVGADNVDNEEGESVGEAIDVEEDVQNDVEEVQDDVGEEQDDVEEVQDDVEEVQDNVEEVEEDVDVVEGSVGLSLFLMFVLLLCSVL